MMRVSSISVITNSFTPNQTPLDESYHECHKGYVSILPAALGLLDSDSPKLKAILELVRDPEELWSPVIVWEWRSGRRVLVSVHGFFACVLGVDVWGWKGF